MAKSLLNGSPEDRETYLQSPRSTSACAAGRKPASTWTRLSRSRPSLEDKIYIYFLRGTIAERQKQYDAAEVQFRKILAIDPNNAMTLNYLGYMLADRGVRLTEAVGIIQQAVKLDPQNGAYLDSLGWAYFKLGQYGPAEENVRKALERMSTDPAVHDHMGDIYEKTGRLKEAAAQWELALSEYAHSTPGDTEPGDVAKVEKKLEGARVRLAKARPQQAPKN